MVLEWCDMKLFVAAKAIIVNEEHKVLIVRESGDYDEGTNVGRWDVVGGRIDPAESLFDGLKREVLEESGLEVEPERVITVDDKFQVIKGEDVHIVRIYYLCRYIGEEVVLSADHDRYEWITVAECSNYNIMSDVKEVFDLL